MNVLNFSFCVVCRNRLQHLKETLARNIIEIENHHNVEFVLLNYSSDDNIDQWVRKNLYHYIEKGKLVYYQYFDAKSYHYSHAKNMLLKLANGDVVYNLNSDHYIGQNFVSYINRVYKNNLNYVISPISLSPDLNPNTSSENFGRLILSKSQFLSIRGFDERIEKYGFEDIDILNRLFVKNIKFQLLDNPEYLDFISHDDNLRFDYNLELKDIEFVLLHYMNPWETEFIVFKKKSIYSRGILIHKRLYSAINNLSWSHNKTNYEYDILDDTFVSSTYVKRLPDLILYRQNRFEIFQQMTNNKFLCRENNKVFQKLTDSQLILNLVKNIYIISNRKIMLQNKDVADLKINSNGFGKGQVYKNFNLDNKLIIE